MMLSLQWQRQVQKVHVMPSENDFRFPPPLGIRRIDLMANSVDLFLYVSKAQCFAGIADLGSDPVSATSLVLRHSF